MNGVNFRYGKYMNGSSFSLGLVYEWGGVRGLQPHIRTQNHGKLPPPRGGRGGAGNYAYKNCLYFSSFHAQVTGYELNIAPVMFSEHVIFVYLSI